MVLKAGGSPLNARASPRSLLACQACLKGTRVPHQAGDLWRLYESGMTWNGLPSSLCTRIQRNQPRRFSSECVLDFVARHYARVRAHRRPGRKDADPNRPGERKDGLGLGRDRPRERQKTPPDRHSCWAGSAVFVTGLSDSSVVHFHSSHLGQLLRQSTLGLADRLPCSGGSRDEFEDSHMAVPDWTRATGESPPPTGRWRRAFGILDWING